MNQGVMQIGMLVVFIAIMYLLLIRPQKKKEKAINEMRNSVRAGDEIITIGGICGKVMKAKDETLIIQVGADKVKFEIMRWAVSKVTETSARPSSRKAAVEEDDEDEIAERKKTLPKRMKRPAAADERAEAEEDVRPVKEKDVPEDDDSDFGTEEDKEKE